jgi:hypothetical protein
MQASEDLTYRLPAYALVQFAKFDVLSRATELHPDATHIFWIDAGLSRFLGESSEVSFAYEPWLPSSGSVFLAITPRLLEDLRKGSPVLYAGTCERLVTGEMFMLRSNKAKDIARRVYGYVESEWLAHDKWDNEQVALGEILSRDPAFAVIVDASGEQAKFAKLVFPRKHLRVFSTFLSVITRLIGFLKR